MKDEPLLEIKDLHVDFRQDGKTVEAVRGADLKVLEGEILGLVGESGSGKSVTALSVTRLLPASAEIERGEILFDGREILKLSEEQLRRIRGAQISYVFQDPATSLNPVFTIGEQLIETIRLHHGSKQGDAFDIAVDLLKDVGMPSSKEMMFSYPHQLSGGMKQRVMIAMAVSCKPKLLIADEPTTALDVTIQAQVLDILRELQSRRRMSVLLITHDLAVVAEMAHRVAVMYAGEVVETADRETFFSRPAHPYSRKLFDSLPARTKRGGALAVIRGTVPPLTRDFVGCRFAERCDHAWDLCRQATPDWHDLGGGQGVRCHLFAKDEQMGEGIGERREAKKLDVQSIAASGVSHLSPLSSLLSVKDLKVHFPIHKGVFKHIVGRVKAVDGVSLTIQSGKTLGLVGESGCGKTTVGKSVLRLIEPTAGQVMLGGEDVLRLGRAQLRTRRRHAQIIFQDPYSSLNPRMRVMETIEEGMAALGLGASRDERQARIDHLLTEVGLAPETKYRYPHEFSGGQRQRVAIARALAVEPQLIVCDEPTSALDVSVQAQILNLLKQLQSKKGLAYLFISHNIAVIEFLAHEVAVMYLGRIVERGTVEEVLDGPKHPYTRALLSAVPVIDRITEREVIRLQGDLPSPVNPPAGCHFHPRCPAALPQCRQAYPKRTDFSATHSTHCHLYPVTQKQ